VQFYFAPMAVQALLSCFCLNVIALLLLSPLRSDEPDVGGEVRLLIPLPWRRHPGGHGGGHSGVRGRGCKRVPPFLVVDLDRLSSVVLPSHFSYPSVARLLPRVCEDSIFFFGCKRPDRPAELGVPGDDGPSSRDASFASSL